MKGLTRVGVADERAARSGKALRALRRIGLSVGGLLLVATLAIGLLHTKPARPLLMKLAGLAGCPLGRASAAEVDAARRTALAQDRGTSPAPSRPALGFELGKTSLADVRAWAQRTGVDCAVEREDTLVKCADVPSRAVGRPISEGIMTELTFGFSRGGPLVAVTTLYSHRAAADTAKIADDAKTRLLGTLGNPHAIAGSFEQVGTTATLSYRYEDYPADVTSSRVPGSGYVVREQYLATLF